MTGGGRFQTRDLHIQTSRTYPFGHRRAVHKSVSGVLFGLLLYHLKIEFRKSSIDIKVYKMKMIKDKSDLRTKSHGSSQRPIGHINHQPKIGYPSSHIPTTSRITRRYSGLSVSIQFSGLAWTADLQSTTMHWSPSTNAHKSWPRTALVLFTRNVKIKATSHGLVTCVTNWSMRCTKKTGKNYRNS